MTAFQPTSECEYLAYTIASEFGDVANLQSYLSSCKKYPLHIIHRAYGEAREFPADRIRKSRAALFFYLIKHYSYENKPKTHITKP
jgi:hypothetical protein